MTTQKRTLIFSLLLGGAVGFTVGACTLSPHPDLPYTDSGKGDGVTSDGGLDPGSDGDSSGSGGASGGEGGQGGEGGARDEN